MHRLVFQNDLTLEERHSSILVRRPAPGELHETKQFYKQKRQGVAHGLPLAHERRRCRNHRSSGSSAATRTLHGMAVFGLFRECQSFAFCFVVLFCLVTNYDRSESRLSETSASGSRASPPSPPSAPPNASKESPRLDTMFRAVASRSLRSSSCLA